VTHGFELSPDDHRLLRDTPVAAPQLVALDAEGDPPALLMTRLPGWIDRHPADLDGHLRRLAEALPAIHAVAPTAAIPDYANYELEAAGPPRWTSRPDVWERAFEVHHGPMPPGERRFLHRDYHPGNVLWADGEVTGIVDWPVASAGPPASDVGYCRRDLAGELGLDAADRFLEHYRAVSGRDDDDPYWDVVATVGGFTEEDWDAGDETFLVHALARL
jgi:aminoglycoside phosphotransferase (APT) family kinase protein